MGICRKYTLGLILALGLILCSLASWASFLMPGQPAPNFLVESGDNQKLSLNMIRGKVIVLFYESRHVIKKNSQLKNVLKRLYRSQPANIKQDVFRLVVIDCTNVDVVTIYVCVSIKVEPGASDSGVARRATICVSKGAIVMIEG